MKTVIENTPDQIPLADIIEWDVKNWSCGLDFWLGHTQIPLSQSRALDLGSRNGGISLFLAQHCSEVICSDLGGPSEQARSLHRKHGVSARVSYADVDAMSIPYPERHFDVVTFKSVLGALGTIERQRQMIAEIYRVLKPGGELWFAENLVGSPLHMAARRLFVKWGRRWRYVSQTEMVEHCRRFSHAVWRSYGFLGAFGRKEWQRYWLGYFDCLIDPVVSSRWRYILFGVLRK